MLPPQQQASVALRLGLNIDRLCKQPLVCRVTVIGSSKHTLEPDGQQLSIQLVVKCPAKAQISKGHNQG